MIYDIFQGFGYDQQASRLLTLLCSFEGAAPTGAPTSPMIGNIVLRRFDQEAMALAEEKGFKYTRYADDLTFSSATHIEIEFLAKVRALIESHGFRFNERKTKFMGRGDRMEVTGLVINEGVQIPREWRNYARGFLHRVIANPLKYADKRHVVYGINGTLKSLDPENRQRLTAQAALAVSAVRGKS